MAVSRVKIRVIVGAAMVTLVMALAALPAGAAQAA